MRIESRSVLVTGSTAVAVWLDLWGSMPMTIMEGGSLLCSGLGESAEDNPTSSTSHSSLGSRLSSVTPRTQTGRGGHTPGGSTQRAGDRNYTSQPFRSATERYGQLTRPRTDDTKISRNYMTADTRRQTMLDARQDTQDVADMMLQVQKITDAVRSTVPRSMWTEILRKLEG